MLPFGLGKIFQNGNRRKMKKFVLTVFILTALILAACSSGAITETETQNVAATETVSSSENTGETGQQPAPQSDGQMNMANQEISELTKLLVGLFKLENTDLTLTTEQASTLITILDSYQELYQNQNNNPEQSASTPDQSSDAMQTQQTTMQALQAEQKTQQEDLIAQIQAVLTTDQLNSISSLELDQDSLSAFLQEQGISFGGNGQQPGGGSGKGTPQGTPSADQSGNVPQVQGTPGNGGPGGNPQNGATPNAQFTPGAGQGGGQSGQGGGFGSTSQILIKALLQLLESKVNI